MTVVDEILQKFHITLIHFGFEFAERDAGGVDNGGFSTQMVDETDPALTVKDLDMFLRRHVEMFHRE